MFQLNFSAKIQEAEEHVRQGEKSLKTSLTKWKPDLDSAIERFEKACTCYRIAEKYEQCRDLSLRVAELQLKKGSVILCSLTIHRHQSSSLRITFLCWKSLRTSRTNVTTIQRFTYGSKIF